MTLGNLKSIEEIDFVPVFEWTLINNETEKIQLGELYSIPDKYSIVARDNNGNILVQFDNKLYAIDHEDPTESPFELTSNFSELLGVLQQLCSIQECTIDTSLREIKESKARLINIKKECPKHLKSYIDSEIQDLTEL